jgi:hypothetical protein
MSTPEERLRKAREEAIRREGEERRASAEEVTSLPDRTRRAKALMEAYGKRLDELVEAAGLKNVYPEIYDRTDEDAAFQITFFKQEAHLRIALEPDGWHVDSDVHIPMPAARITRDGLMEGGNMDRILEAFIKGIIDLGGR